MVAYTCNKWNQIILKYEGGITMNIMVNRTVNSSVDDKVNLVLDMLNEAIEEYERNEFVLEEELFMELETIC